MNKNNYISDDVLEKISGGVLPQGWEKIVDMYAPSYLKQYEGITYEKACELIATYITDEEDQKLVFEYIKKYF